MGWKFETEVFIYEENKWKTGYMGNSLIKAVLSIRRLRKDNPGRAYRIIIR